MTRQQDKNEGKNIAEHYRVTKKIKREESQTMKRGKKKGVTISEPANKRKRRK